MLDNLPIEIIFSLIKFNPINLLGYFQTKKIKLADKKSKLFLSENLSEKLYYFLYNTKNIHVAYKHKCRIKNSTRGKILNKTNMNKWLNAIININTNKENASLFEISKEEFDPEKCDDVINLTQSELDQLNEIINKKQKAKYGDIIKFKNYMYFNYYGKFAYDGEKVIQLNSTITLSTIIPKQFKVFENGINTTLYWANIKIDSYIWFNVNKYKNSLLRNIKVGNIKISNKIKLQNCIYTHTNKNDLKCNKIVYIVFTCDHPIQFSNEKIIEFAKELINGGNMLYKYEDSVKYDQMHSRLMYKTIKPGEKCPVCGSINIKNDGFLGRYKKCDKNHGWTESKNENDYTCGIIYK